VKLDPIRLVEACYAPEPDERAWARGMLEALAPADAGFGVVATSMDARAPASERIRCLSELGVEVDWLSHFGRWFASPAARPFLEFVGGARFHDAALASRRLWCAAPKIYEPFRLLYESVGLGDSFAMVVPTGNGDDVELHIPIPLGQPPPPPRTRQQLSSAVSHLASAFRLRRSLNGRGPGPGDLLTEAVLDPRGRVLHLTQATRERAVRGHLVEAVRRMDRARGGLRWRSPEEALTLWEALIDGRWSLVDHVDSDGHRFVLARRNPPGRRDLRALFPRERAVVALALEGHSNKRIGFELGLAPSTIAGHLRSSQAKLGVESRRALIAMLGGGMVAGYGAG
jgi:DNA-binding CsgD family transcriptional regulator